MVCQEREEHRCLSSDGKTLTMTTAIPGQTKPNIQVFDRE